MSDKSRLIPTEPDRCSLLQTSLLELVAADDAESQDAERARMQDLYLAQVKKNVDAPIKDPYALASLFDTSGSSRTYRSLRQSLSTGPALRVTSYVSLARSFFPDYRPFAEFLAAYLLFVRDADLGASDGPTATAAYQLAEDCFKAADKVFAQGETGWFVPVLRKLTATLISLGLRAGRLSGDNSLTKASDAATLLRRPMTIASADRSTESLSKRDAIFFFANATFKVYFALSNLRLCDTILNNTQSAVGSLDRYPKADRVAFYYNRGRIFLYQRRLPQARQDLKKAFELCHFQSTHNARLILTYLVAASLPLGIFPSEDLLQLFDLQDQFGDLLPALQLGDYKGVVAALDAWQSWHRDKGNYLLLKEKLQVICWRNLARRSLFISDPSNRSPAKGPPTLPLEVLLRTAKVSFDDPTLDLDDIECMVASLAEQGYIKAYVMHSKRLLVLQKGPMVGFPAVAEVHPV